MTDDLQRYDSIRPYNAEESRAVLAHLADHADVLRGILALSGEPDTPASRARVSELLSGLTSADDFQVRVVYPVMRRFLSRAATGYELEGTECLSERENRLYISNHRDIILDSVLLSIMLYEHGRRTVASAIGDNLFARDWIEPLLRMNHGIVVRRGLPVRQMLAASSELSGCIRSVVTSERSVWIAQREGRAKNSDDRTQTSLLKMLNLSGEGSVKDNALSLGLTPLSLSYEYDPCDFLKAKEFQLRRDNPAYRKTLQDDVDNMVEGIRGYKGHIHYRICPIEAEIRAIPDTLGRNEQLEALTALVDRAIFRGYRIYPINRVAYWKLTGDDRFRDVDSPETVAEVRRYIESRVRLTDFPGCDPRFIHERIVEMYANPLINHLRATEA